MDDPADPGGEARPRVVRVGRMLRRHRAQVRVTTSVEGEGRRLFNSLRVREYPTAWSRPLWIGSWTGCTERWFPKADLDGRDRPVVVILASRRTGGATSRGPITSLHLGNARGSLGEVRSLAARLPGRDGDLRTGRGVLPGCLQVGDMFSSDGPAAVAR